MHDRNESLLEYWDGLWWALFGVAAGLCYGSVKYTCEKLLRYHYEYKR